LGAAALKRGELDRAIKLLQKSMQLYPLPGVEALLMQAKREQIRQQQNDSNQTRSQRPPPQSSASTISNESAGANGRAYSEEQVRIVKEVLQAKEGGRGAHYRVLGLRETSTEAEIKKAYRKLSLKVHPDKNSAPHSDEAFKAVGLAYATLSDPQKRSIYDRYGDEDPDNRGGGAAAAGPFGMHMRRGHGAEVSPEEIFNMFFGGGMPGMHAAGGPGFRVYTTGFGPGVQFRPQQRQRRRQPEAEQGPPGLGVLFQFLPLLVILLFSFFRVGEEEVASRGAMPGENKHFSLTVSIMLLVLFHTLHRLTSRIHVLL
jgi:DnaJ homolog subfamily B member 12